MAINATFDVTTYLFTYLTFNLMTLCHRLNDLMTFKSYLEHTDSIFEYLGILNLNKLNDYLTSLFMFRYHHLNNLPEVFTNYYVRNSQVHKHNTRNSSKLQKSYQRTNYIKHSLSNKGIDVWNSLSAKLKNVASYNIFKVQSKKYFLKI